MKNRHQFFDTWKKHSDEVTAVHMAARCFIRAVLSRSGEDRETLAHTYLARSLSSVTNEIKLRNGRYPFDTMKKTVHSLRHGLLSIEKNDTRDKILVSLLSTLTTSELQDFEELVVKLYHEFPTREYAYFVLGSDLSPEQKMVQCSHVALKLASQSKIGDPDKLHFVVLETDDLSEKARVLEANSIGYVSFTDFGRVTALAAQPISWDDMKKRSIFKTDKLVRFAAA